MKKVIKLYYQQAGMGPISWNGVEEEWRKKKLKIKIINREKDGNEQWAKAIIVGSKAQINKFLDNEFTVHDDALKWH